MQDQLPMTVPDRWTVEPVFRRQTRQQIAAGAAKELKHYALMYAGEIQKKATTERETDSLREMAKFLNRRNMAPRPRVQCWADTNIPPLPRKKPDDPSCADPQEHPQP